MIGSGRCRWRGFTLVDVLVAVLIIGILAAIVVPRYSNARQEAVAGALMGNLVAVKKLVDYHYHSDGNGAYPAAIDPTWFPNDTLPDHPENSFGIAAVQTASVAGMTHPTNKVLKAGVTGAYWYNSAEGFIRARVADQGSQVATLDFYNRVNQSDEAALGNYGGGGGGGS